jgi:hypothetical protein
MLVPGMSVTVIRGGGCLLFAASEQRHGGNRR